MNDTTHLYRLKTLEATPRIEHLSEMFILGMSEQDTELAVRKGSPLTIVRMGQSYASLTHVI